MAGQPPDPDVSVPVWLPGLPTWRDDLALPEPPPAPAPIDLPFDFLIQPALGPRAEEGSEIERLLAAMSSEVARGPVRPATRASALEVDRYVHFRLGGTDYVVPLSAVLETGRVPVITPVPNVPPWVLGVANVRGDILSMLDLRGFLGVTGTAPARRLLVARSARDDLMAGLLVDQVRGIRAVPAEAFRAVGPAGDNRLALFQDGLAELDGNLFVRLDLERLLRSPELRQFELV